MNCMADIDRAIEQSGLDESLVAREAGLGPRYLYNVRSGYRTLTPRTVNRIRLALSELKRRRKLAEREKEQEKEQEKSLKKGERADPSRSRSAAQYRMALACVAFAEGVSPRFILDTDPSRRATADQQWLRAAQLRRLSLYVANQYLNVPGADLARAAGMSKANVSIALGAIEDMRGRPELERVLAHVEEAFT